MNKIIYRNVGYNNEKELLFMLVTVATGGLAIATTMWASALCGLPRSSPWSFCSFSLGFRIAEMSPREHAQTQRSAGRSISIVLVLKIITDKVLSFFSKKEQD